MPVSTQLFEKKIPAAIAFLGGKGRNFLISKMAQEVTRKGKKVIVTHLDKEMLPVLGEIVVAKTEKSLFNKIEEALQNEAVVYAGSASTEEFITGINSKIAKKLSGSGLADHYFYILGPAEEKSFLKEQSISEAIKADYLDSFLFCFQSDQLDLEISKNNIENETEFYDFYKDLKSEKILRQELISDYLINSEHGILKSVPGNINFKLIFTDVSSILSENKVINIARELKIKKVNEVYMANLSEELLKKVIA